MEGRGHNAQRQHVVLFAPATDEFFFAARGQGAERNRLRVHATAGTELDFSRIAGPKPLVARLINLYGEITAKALENEQKT